MLPDRRRWPRKDLELRALVRFEPRLPVVRAVITNASERGLFIAIDPPKDVGTLVRVEIPAAADRPAIIVTGTVVRRVLAPSGAPMPTGVGVFLGEMTPEWVDLVARLLAQPRQ